MMTYYDSEGRKAKRIGRDDIWPLRAANGHTWAEIKELQHGDERTE